MLSILLHVVTGIKRTRDTSLNLPRMGDKRVLDLADTGLILLTFTTSHLFQFRFGDTDQFGPYTIRPPPTSSTSGTCSSSSSSGQRTPRSSRCPFATLRARV